MPTEVIIAIVAALGGVAAEMVRRSRKRSSDADQKRLVADSETHQELNRVMDLMISQVRSAEQLMSEIKTLSEKVTNAVNNRQRSEDHLHDKIDRLVDMLRKLDDSYNELRSQMAHTNRRD